MYKFVFVFLLAIPVAAVAQDLKKVTVRNKEDGYTEVYFVFKSDGKTRQGAYKKLGTSNEVLQTGYYANGAMDSLWTEYGFHKQVRTTGYYSKGNRVGVWEFYDNGELEQRYDYDKKQMTFNRQAEGGSKPVFRILNMDAAEAIHAIAPVYIGGEISLLRFLMRTIRYPVHSRDNDIQGKVVIGITIDASGKQTALRIITGAADDLNAEALRVVGLLPNGWVPAQLNGKPVDAEYSFPVSFKLN